MVSLILVTAAPAAAGDVFVSVSEAEALRARGAVLLDARGAEGFGGGHLPDSAPLAWTELRDRGGNEGSLSASTAALQQKLRAAGVSSGAPVVVYDAGYSGWGEAGRIWWTLSYLGHDDVYILDGGVSAWEAAGRALSREPATTATGDFVARPDASQRIGLEGVSSAVADCQGGACGVVFWDTREAREYGGATPYGEARGGHLPGAVGLHYKQLLDSQGRLRPEAELRALLSQAGITPDRQIVPYCTGGVRSAFAAAVLEELGYASVANYDGSMWEWAADPQRPLE